LQLNKVNSKLRRSTSTQLQRVGTLNFRCEKTDEVACFANHASVSFYCKHIFETVSFCALERGLSRWC